MLSVDTNVIVRYLVRDDLTQATRVDNLLLNNPVWVPKTVLVETECVLRGSYLLDRDRIAPLLRALAGIPNIHLEAEFDVSLALDWFAEGMDFADALHLASSSRATQFVTFDRRLAAKAAKLTPARVLLLH